MILVKSTFAQNLLSLLQVDHAVATLPGPEGSSQIMDHSGAPIYSDSPLETMSTASQQQFQPNVDAYGYPINYAEGDSKMMWDQFVTAPQGHSSRPRQHAPSGPSLHHSQSAPSMVGNLLFQVTNSSANLSVILRHHQGTKYCFVT